MIIQPIKPPDSTTLKSLTSDWNLLISQLQNHNKSKPDLLPILSQRKSPLQNYKNAIKLHQANSAHKKTLTQKILDLSRKRKLSTVNLNKQVTKHKRNPSQQLPILTEEQSQLLVSKQQTKRQKPTQPKTSLRKIDLANAKSIINQFKLFKRQTHKNDTNHSNQQQRKSPLRDMIKERKSKTKLIIEQTLQLQQKHINSSTFDGRLSQLVKEQNQQNKRLSLQLSHDSKSLRYRYNKQQLQQRRERGSIPSVLKRRRKQPTQTRCSLPKPIHTSIESHKLIKYPPQQQQSLTTNKSPKNKNKNKTELLKLQSKVQQMQKNVFPLKPMPQSHIKQRHYVPRKKISLRTISHNDNSPMLKYEPWDNPEQYLETIYIENCSFNL